MTISYHPPADRSAIEKNKTVTCVLQVFCQDSNERENTIDLLNLNYPGLIDRKILQS